MNRLNEINQMNNGQWATIIRYNNNKDIDVLFIEDGFIAYNKQYVDFKRGSIYSGFTKNKYGGYIGYAKTKDVNNKVKLSYQTWVDMLKRCGRNKTYKDVVVNKGWLCYEKFEKWFNINYYIIDGATMHLDKDVLCKVLGNSKKTYSEDTCMFLPSTINLALNSKNKHNIINVVESYKGKLPHNIYSNLVKYIDL